MRFIHLNEGTRNQRKSTTKFLPSISDSFSFQIHGKLFRIHQNCKRFPGPKTEHPISIGQNATPPPPPPPPLPRPCRDFSALFQKQLWWKIAGVPVSQSWSGLPTTLPLTALLTTCCTNHIQYRPPYWPKYRPDQLVHHYQLILRDPGADHGASGKLGRAETTAEGEGAVSRPPAPRSAPGSPRMLPTLLSTTFNLQCYWYGPTRSDPLLPC